MQLSHFGMNNANKGVVHLFEQFFCQQKAYFSVLIVPQFRLRVTLEKVSNGFVFFII